MDNPQKTTSFSAHLSWAAMRRFLQERTSAEESQQIELHLNHCPRCSSAIIGYIQTEEPQNYKHHMNKLKGNLTSSQTARKRLFSPFQLKAIRATAAVIALVVFSFFAFKTVVSQHDTNRLLPSESLAVMKKKSKTTTTDRKETKKIAKPTKTTTTTSPKKAPVKQKAVEKKSVAKKVEQKTSKPVRETITVPKKKKVEPKPQPASTPKVAEKTEQTPEKQPEVQVPAVATSPEATTPSSEAKEEAAIEAEEEVKVVRLKPLPTLQKQSSTQLETKKSVQPMAPIGNKQPAVIPVPGNQIRER